MKSIITGRKNNSPKITVITISYNSVKFIERTIISVLSQDYNNIEYIIIDGGSNDGTKEIIEKYNSQIFFWCSEKDNGIYDAMNKGIKYSTGDWICFMNSGDIFATQNTISNVFCNKIEQSINVIFGDCTQDFGIKKIIKKATKISKISYKMPFCHQSCFIRTSIQKNNLYDTSFKIASDYNLFYDLYYKINKNCFKYYNETISIIDCTDSLTQRNKFICWAEYLRIRSQHKNVRWYYDYVKYLIKRSLGYGKKQSK